jgi:hypothetical protein
MKKNYPMFYDCQFSENIAGDDIVPAVTVEFTGEHPVGYRGHVTKGKRGVIAAKKTHTNNPSFPSGVAYILKMEDGRYFGWTDSKFWKIITE